MENSRGRSNGEDREEEEVGITAGGSSMEEGATRKFRVRESGIFKWQGLPTGI